MNGTILLLTELTILYVLILALRQAPEIHTNQLTHARLLHRYAINYIYRAHRRFIMCHNDELGVLTEFTDHIGKLSHVRIIQRRIHLIEYTEWCGFYQIDSKQ